MRRSLVLTTEAARHPFRASLPPHALTGADPIDPVRQWRLTAGDVRGFVSAYCASLVVVAILIA
jgi:hypothetical protein